MELRSACGFDKGSQGYGVTQLQGAVFTAAWDKSCSASAAQKSFPMGLNSVFLILCHEAFPLDVSFPTPTPLSERLLLTSPPFWWTVWICYWLQANLFFKLRYNSHIMKFSLLRCAVQWVFSIFITSCNHHHYLIPEHFYYPRIKCCTH